MLTLLRRHSFLLSLVGLAFLCFALAEVAHADVKGIPYSERFQAAAYPFARVVPGCTEWRLPAHLTDSFGGVSFAGACRAHDQCFHTLGATWEDCNAAYRQDLRAACDRELERQRLEQGRSGKPDAQAVALCYEATELYLVPVQGPEAKARFHVAQLHELAYLDYVREVVDQIYRGLLRRPATAKEKSRALATLTEDYSLDDLKTALMGHRLDLDVAERLP